MSNALNGIADGNNYDTAPQLSKGDSKSFLLRDNIKLGIADDHDIFIKGITLCFRGNQRFSFVLATFDGQQLLDKLSTSSVILPDIILMDLRMPVMDGLEATIEVKRLYPFIKVVAFTMRDHLPWIEKFKNIGGDGYVTKSIDPAELCNVLEDVHRGLLYFPGLQ